jgi:hypothetical protein
MTAMMRIAATSGSVTTRFDAFFSAMIANCAEFCAGARQGRDIEQCDHALDHRLALISPGLGSLELTSHAQP